MSCKRIDSFRMTKFGRAVSIGEDVQIAMVGRYPNQLRGESQELWPYRVSTFCTVHCPLVFMAWALAETLRLLPTIVKERSASPSVLPELILPLMKAP